MATDAVYKYLKKQNRPFGVNDIVTNMQNQYSKAVVQKAVDELAGEQKIYEKVYGKQKIYCVVQDSQYDTEELKRINTELQAHAHEVESKFQEIEKEVKAQEAVLTALKNSLTLNEAQKEKHRLEESVKVLTEKLEQLMSATGTEHLGDSKRKAEQAVHEYSSEYSKRKRICTEILDCILENYAKSKTDLYDELGIETKIVQ